PVAESRHRRKRLRADPSQLKTHVEALAPNHEIQNLPKPSGMVLASGSVSLEPVANQVGAQYTRPSPHELVQMVQKQVAQRRSEPKAVRDIEPGLRRIQDVVRNDAPERLFQQAL